MNEVEDTIRRYVAESAKLDPAAIEADTDLVQDLGLSSLELLNVVAFVEQRYRITVADRELVSLTTLRRIAAKVREERAAEGEQA